MANRDLVAFFYPSAKQVTARAPSQADTIRAIRALLGGAGVAVLEAMEHAAPKERGQLASVVQTEFRKLMRHRIEPVLPRSSTKTPQHQPSSGTRRR